MSGLVLKLSPKERVLINGVVVENGDRRSRLAIMTPEANILRLRDAIHPEEAKTPVRRVCVLRCSWCYPVTKLLKMRIYPYFGRLKN